MKTSEAGINLIAGFEGFRAERYLDIVGVPTIGYGETKASIVARGRISESEARKLLRQRVDRDFAPAVQAAIERPINQHQLDACVSLAYNIGTGGFADSTVVRELNAGNVRAAGRAFMLWVKAGGQTVEGLVRRRRAEVALFQRDVVEPVAYSDKERYLMRLAAAKGIEPRRRARARDWLAAQQGEIARRARGDGWATADRSRRFRGIRKALGLGRPQ